VLSSRPKATNQATIGSVGLGLNSYGYVSGNWCWIRAKRLDLRYGLSHGPRIAIFFITIVIYTYIYIKLKRVFKNLRSITATTEIRTAQDHQSTAPIDINDDTRKILVNHSVSVSHEMNDMPRTPDSPDQNSINVEGAAQPTVTIQATANNRDTFQASRMAAAPNLRKMLLMNGYPIAYIILWIPGIANRLAESVGQSPRWLTALQACTQYIGLINAITYGMSEQTRRGVWKKLKDTGTRGR
jgi:hypothetical protein